MSQSKLSSFTKFPRLANELQDLIWECSLKDRLPAAHFATLGSHLLKSPQPNGGFESMWAMTFIEELAWCDPPPDLAETCPRRETHLDILLRTCKQSRRIALRHRKSWGPQGTLQLYDPRVKDRLDTLDLSRDLRRNPRQTPGCSDFDYMPPQLFDLPSRMLDNSQDLVILGLEWIDVSRRFHSDIVYAKLEWRIPPPRVPYLALTYSTRFGESLDSQLMMVAGFLRLRTAVLYILINPDELDENDAAKAKKARPDTVKARREALETPCLLRTGVESLVANAPDRFWYGSREYYTLSWDDVEEKMMCSASWRQLALAIERARMMTLDFCIGCQRLDCNNRPDTYPAIWKIMSWRDREQRVFIHTDAAQFAA